MPVIHQILKDQPVKQEEGFTVGAPIAKKRVAAYCRVSTDMDGQLNSLETQMTVFREQISKHPGWELADIYADEGISGTSTAKRPEFLRMVRDCEEGKIDYIITKSISRFARNTLECLNYVRHLQSLGVQLMFEKENIDTGTAFSEMLLTVLAAFAQEESRSLSENQKWAYRKKMEEGEPRWHTLYGYRKGETCDDYIIDPDEAAVVQEAFDRYEHGEPCSKIAKHFDACGYPPSSTSPKPGSKRALQNKPAGWDPTVIHSMLTNEKYVGDYLTQKRYTADHLTRKSKKNDQSVLPSYYLRDHHRAIIRREQFVRVNKIMGMRNLKLGSMQYPFDDKLVCPICGKRLIQRRLEVLERKSTWRCERDEKSCGGYALKASIIEKAVLDAYHSVDIAAVPTECKRKAQQKAAEMLIAMRQKHPRLKHVDYYWVDDLIDRITFSIDKTLTIHWKGGMRTTVPLPIRHHREDPIYAAEVYRKRVEAGDLIYEGKYKQPMQRKVNANVIGLIEAQD